MPTTAGLLPDLCDVAKVPGMVVDGIGQGIHDAIDDLKNPSELFSFDDNPILNLADYSALQQVVQESFPLPTSPSDSDSIIDAVGDAASQLYSALLPTADIVTALFATLPAYDVEVFFDELADGDLLGALGYPLAVDNALLPLAGLFELLTVGEAVTFAAADLAAPVIDVSGLVDDFLS